MIRKLRFGKRFWDPIDSQWWQAMEFVCGVHEVAEIDLIKNIVRGRIGMEEGIYDSAYTPDGHLNLLIDSTKDLLPIPENYWHKTDLKNRKLQGEMPKKGKPGRPRKIHSRGPLEIALKERQRRESGKRKRGRPKILEMVFMKIQRRRNG